MGRTTSNVSAAEINAVISSIMASIQVSNSTMMDQSTKSTQINSNSTRCKNVKVSRNKVVYSSDSQIFTDLNAVQSIYVQLLNQLETTNTVDETGGSWGSTDATTKAGIMNILQTKLTQSEIVNYTNSFISSNSSLQVCQDSKGGINLLIGTQKELYNVYVDQYSQMEATQSVSADIANYLSAAQDVKKTGLLAVITKAIALVCIAIIIIAAIVVVIVY